MSEVKVNKITPTADCGTVTLGDSGDTVAIASGVTLTSAGSITNSGTITNTGTISGGTITGTIDGQVNWQTTIKTSNFTASNGEGYFVNTTSGAITVTLPSSPSAGNIVGIKDYANTADTNNITIGRNGSNIQGAANDFIIDTEGLAIILLYVDATKGWLSVGQSKASDIEELKEYVTATGGTVTTCGDFKIHTFTGPGTFCVSDAGNSAGSNSVEYLVVAGGGGGGRGGNSGGGGGGAGGFRFASPSLAPATYPAKPLAGPANLPVSVQGYPVTVAGGGAGGPGPGTNPGLAVSGSNSIFSTITSAGGGKGGGSTAAGGPAAVGTSGGSGGGAGNSGNASRAGGSGNTPPVSPAQGSDGGDSYDGSAPFFGASSQGGGGGGAISAGTDRTSSTSSVSAAPGGTGGGLPTAFGSNGEPCGSFRYYAGGGGGASRADYIYPSVPSNGGLGGGGNGGSAVGCGILASPSMNATTNTGGGGGGAATVTDNPGTPGPYPYPFPGSPLAAAGGSGGSGIVVIRYKYQN